MFRRLMGAALVCGASVVAMPAVFAQGMTFGEEEVAEKQAEVQASATNQVVEEGKKLYEQDKFAEAALLFYKVLSDDDAANAAARPEAEYELAKALFRLGLYQGALTYYGRIVDAGETHPYFLPALRGLVLLTDEIPEDPLLQERLSAYGDYFPQDVPEKYRDRFAYMVGRYKYSMLEVDDALRLLNAVSTRSDDYTRSRYIAAVTHVANYDAEPAVEAFKEVLRFLTAKQENDTLSAEEKKLLQLANLGMARVFYSTGQYDTSLKYYERIPRASDLWPVALFESSWAYFQLDLFNKALGNLHSLNSPFFSDYYFPEGPILSAVLFFYNCKYDRVRNVLDDFVYDYEPIQQDVEAALSQHADDPEALYNWLLEQQNAGAEASLAGVINAALDDEQIQRKVRLINAIDQEKEKLAEMPETFTSSPLGGALVQESELASSFARADAGGLVEQRLQRVSRELQNQILEQKKILFEVARAERGEIESDLRAEMKVERKVTDVADVEVSDEELYWEFDGEYWRDELGFYIFNVNSECKR